MTGGKVSSRHAGESTASSFAEAYRALYITRSSE